MGIARLLIAAFALLGTAAAQTSAKFAWNPNPETGIAGYKLHLGTTSGALGDVRSVGKTSGAEITGLAHSTTYYAAISAVNDAGLESPLSGQITFTTAPAPVPDIAVTSPGGVNLSGNSSPVSFGSVAIGGAGPEFPFGVSNAGTADLTGLAYSISGKHAADFKLTATGSSILIPGSSAGFSIVFTPSAEGPRSATLAISSNDPEDNPFLIPLGGVGTVESVTPLPAISVGLAGGAAMNHGSAAFSFGARDLLAASASQSFTITSSGNTSLGSLALSLTGTHASDFTVSALPVSSLAIGASTGFTVSFKPAAIGAKTATLRILSSDPARSPFDIALAGTGTAAPGIAVERPNGTALTGGVSFGSLNLGGTEASNGFVIRSTGSASLTGLSLSLAGSHPGDFSFTAIPATISPGGNASFSVIFKPLAAGSRGAILRISSNDESKNPFDITLTGTGVAVPEIDVVRSDGSALTGGVSAIAFGSQNLGGPGVSNGFVIRSTGSASLTGLSLSLAGSHPGDFTFTTIPATVSPGGNASFSVTFKPLAAGSRGAILRIASNDTDENPFDISLNGTGVAVPEIDVVRSDGSALTDGVSAIAFGSQNLGGAGVSNGFVIRSTGSASLTGLSLSLAGSHPGDFTFTTIPATVSPGGNASFSVTFKPLAAGSRGAILRIASNDTDENPFDISLNGTGVAVPEIAVANQAGFDLKSGVSAVGFNSQELGSAGETLSFTISNTGSAILSGVRVSLTGSHPADFGITTQPSPSIAPGGASVFSVTFLPLAAGSRSAELRIAGNDTDENPFIIALAGNATATPDIEITLDDGTTDPLVRGQLDIGAMDLGAPPIERQILIHNRGTGPLQNLSLRLAGPHAADFRLSSLASSAIAPGANLPLAVRFEPRAGGQRSAVLTVSSNDPDEATLGIPLSGLALTHPRIDVSEPQLGTIIHGSSTLRFGGSAAGASGATKTLTIRNTGNGPLSRLKVVVEGPNARDFRIAAPLPGTIAPGGRATVRIGFSPLAAGGRGATLRITSNDASKGAIAIPLNGTGIATPRIEVRMAGHGALRDGSSVVTFATSGRKAKRTFTIVNRGSAPLAGIDPQVSGTHRADFRLTRPGANTLAPGKSMTFRIDFNPKGGGIRWAALRITSNDPSVRVFDVVLTGGRGQMKKSKSKAASRKAEVTRAAKPRVVASTVVVGGQRYRCLTIAKSRGDSVRLSDIQVSGNLIDWKSGRRHLTVIANSATLLKVRDKLPLPRGGKRHIRLRPSALR